MTHVLGRNSRWIPPLARKAFQRFGSGLAERHRNALVELIEGDWAYREAWRSRLPPRIRHLFLDAPPMQPRPGALAACALPALAAPGDIARWLGIAPAELGWFSNPSDRVDALEGPLGHYRYRWIPKRQGGYRLMEAPKPRLREFQRKILAEILDPVPPHRAAHGFRRAHSCRTFAQPHVGRDVVIRMDLRNFFASIARPRVHALFATLGYPAASARVLTALCTNRLPPRFVREIPGAPRGYELPWSERRELESPHLPQGAPTSPAIANLCALHLDLRLDALAVSADGNYTRYADDLALSGGEAMRRRTSGLLPLVAAIAMEEGFAVNHHKTRTMHRSDRQILTGIVLNEKLNIPRVEYDRIKAILHNCVGGDPAAQNRSGHGDFRAHLAGRIGHVKALNPTRGMKLQALFERIEWR